MKLLPLLLLSFSAISCASTSKVTPPNNSFLLTNINIVDVENRRIQSDKSVLVRDGKIQEVTEASDQYATSTLNVINGQGGYLTPGLIDMHVHMFERAAFTLAMSHGVTHVRIMNGIPKQLEWRDQVASGELIGSSATVSSPILSAYDTYLHHTVLTAEQAQAAVKTYQSQGYDLIKAYGNLNEEALTALINTAKLAGIPVAKHGPHASGDMPLSSLKGMQSLEHIEDIFQGPLNYTFSSDQLPTIAQEIKAIDVPVTPTLNIFYQLTKLSDEKEQFLATIPKDYTSDIIALEAHITQVDRWLTASDRMAQHNNKTLTFLKEITKAFNDARVTLLVGSDSGALLSPHGLATHNEMKLMQESGIDVFDVLAAATINPAKALKLDDKMGKISAFYNADFIFTQVNPVNNLSALKSPDAVIKKGVYYSRQDLAKLRETAINSRSIWEELGALFEAF